MTFISKYDRHYPSLEEYEMRFEVFKENLEYIENHNHTQGSVSLNKFMDWTDEEFEGTSGASEPVDRENYIKQEDGLE